MRFALLPKQINIIIKIRNIIESNHIEAEVLLLDKNADNEKLKSALKDLDKAVELDPKFVDALYYKAVVQMKLGDYKGAVETLDKVLAIDPQAVYSRALKKLILQKYLK